MFIANAATFRNGYRMSKSFQFGISLRHCPVLTRTQRTLQVSDIDITLDTGSSIFLCDQDRVVIVRHTGATCLHRLDKEL
jgi:hypothetical protein